jgi:hypothetical protein
VARLPERGMSVLILEARSVADQGALSDQILGLSQLC